MRTSIILFIMIFLLLINSCEDESIKQNENYLPVIISYESVDNELVIQGENFGETQSSGIVFVNDIPAEEYVYWCDSEIIITIPSGIFSGKVKVEVDGKKSNEIDFVVEAPNAGGYLRVKIGSQVWMVKNLHVRKYRNGDPIPLVTDGDKWMSLTTDARCYYDNNSDNCKIYGTLYNWYAVNDPRGLAPSGWHVPSDEEWKQLEIELGMDQAAADDWNWRGKNQGSKLAGNYDLWDNGNLRNSSRFDSSGFSALPGGMRGLGGWNTVFGSKRFRGYWWTSTSYNSDDAIQRYLQYYYSGVNRNYDYKRFGNSVRCLKD